MYRLFQQYARRYDLHTPAGHYKHDHAFVLAEAGRAARADARLLDIGCGTGVFIEAALAAGLDAFGLDAAPSMIEVAAARLGPGRVRLERMQELSEKSTYDAVCALSWTIHNFETCGELNETVYRCREALRPGGVLLLQVANAARITATVNIDREPGPAGEPDDTVFIQRFQPLHDAEHGVLADYVYASQAHGELLAEQHHLRFCAPRMVEQAMRAAGMENIVLVDSTSISPFVVGRLD